MGNLPGSMSRAIGQVKNTLDDVVYIGTQTDFLLYCVLLACLFAITHLLLLLCHLWGLCSLIVSSLLAWYGWDYRMLGWVFARSVM